MNDPRYAILALAPQVWHAQWVNRQQLLSRIGRDHLVLYSNGGWVVWDRASDAWRNAAFSGRFVPSDNVWLDESPRYLMRWPRFTPLDRAVMRSQARRWLHWFRTQGNLPLIAHICHPRFAPYVDLVNPDYVVYHVYDLYDHMPGWQSEWGAWEQALLRRANLVFCPSTMLADALCEKVTRKVEILPNAADVGAFFRAAEQGAAAPSDLARIPHPRIGWVGSVHPQIDYALIATLARRRPNWQFVFVGNKVRFAESEIEQEYLDCERLNNVHFLGYKHRDDVPPYVLNMDVNIMCYRMSDSNWVQFAYPLKLHEYLASGKPVVSANLKMLQVHADVLRFATGADEWESAIDEALTRGGVGTRERRVAVAGEHSWDSRAALLQRWLVGLSSPQPA